MRILLIDGDSLLVRASRATAARRDMSSADRAAAAIGSVLKAIRITGPESVMIGWDYAAGELWRRRIYPEYKGSRRRSGLPNLERGIAMEILELMGLDFDVFPGCEADDVVAAYWRLRESDDEVIIATGDKDLLQLVRSNVRVLMPVGGYWDEARVRESYGVGPAALPLLRALEGDRSDNIPGLRQTGRKRALRLIQEHPEPRVIWVLSSFSGYEIRRWDKYLAVMDLNGAEAVEHHRDPLHLPPFSPVRSRDDSGYTELLRALGDHGMTRLAAALEDGTMWGRAG